MDTMPMSSGKAAVMRPGRYTLIALDPENRKSEKGRKSDNARGGFIVYNLIQGFFCFHFIRPAARPAKIIESPFHCFLSLPPGVFSFSLPAVLSYQKGYISSKDDTGIYILLSVKKPGIYILFIIQSQNNACFLCFSPFFVFRAGFLLIIYARGRTCAPGKMKKRGGPDGSALIPLDRDPDPRRGSALIRCRDPRRGSALIRLDRIRRAEPGAVVRPSSAAGIRGGGAGLIRLDRIRPGPGGRL